MNTKFVLATLAIVVAASLMVGCSKEATTPAVDAKAAAANTFKAPTLPSIYANAEFKDLALAVDVATQDLLKEAKATKDVEKLAPPIKNFVAKRDELLSKIHDNTIRQGAFREVMQKNMATPEDRQAYAQAMTAYYKVTGAPASKAVPIKRVEPAASAAGGASAPVKQ